MAARQRIWLTRKTTYLLSLVALILLGYCTQLPHLVSNTPFEKIDEKGIPNASSPKRPLRRIEKPPADERPPLDALVSDVNYTIIGNVQFLLDFAIVGFGKCGTTSLMHWFYGHPDVAMFPREAYGLAMNRPDAFVKNLYTKHPPDQHLLRAYKSPTDLLTNVAPKLYAKHFPETRLIVGIRHPVLWFQSFYNFKLQNMNNKTGVLPDPEFMMGPCTNENPLCTLRGHFAMHLYRLGKTATVENQTATHMEVLIKQRARKDSYWPAVATPNPVFLYDTSQLLSGDREGTEEAEKQLQASQFARFRRALLQYVGLERDFLETPHYSPGRPLDNATQAHKDAHKIFICDAKHVALRTHLMELAFEIYTWIQESFLPHADVYVSDPGDFQTAMEAWLVDPCDAASS